MTQTKAKGFTLVELLVVIAIIGLLSTLAVVALGSARSKARDARRISDIKQVQTALELYYADQGAYPIVNPTEVRIGVEGTTDVLTDKGFEDATSAVGTIIYMGKVPINFASPATEGYDYLSDANGSTYTISFEIEGTVSGLSGVVSANPSGIQ